MEHLITILDDDKTWTKVSGTYIKVLTEDEMVLVERGADPSMRGGLGTYNLTNPVHLRALADRIEANRRGA